MIILKEDIPQKLSGLTSIFLEMDYHPEIVELIKENCEIYNYNKKTHIWELPVKGINKVIDRMSVFDDVNIINKEDTKNCLERKFNTNYVKVSPFKYQEEGINYGINHNKWLLLDDMGLGKSYQAICIAQELFKLGEIEHCFIICGVNSLKTNWKKEIQKFTNMSCMILGERINSKGKSVFESVEYRANQLKNKIDEFFIITNIETLRDDRIVDAFNTSVNNFGMIVFDELQVCKDINSIQGKNLFKIDAPYKLGMTGTPIINSPLDAYVPLKWIDIEHSTLTNFKNYYCIYSERIKGMITGFKNLDILKEELSNCSLRRTKDLLELPEKTIIPEYVDMEESHRKIYEEVVKGIKDDIDKVKLYRNNLLSLVTRLRQATSCPQVLTSKPILSTKIKRCIELTTDLINSNEKVVIFTSFKDSAYQVGDLLKSYNPLVITGDSSDGETSNAIDDFQNNPNAKIIVATYQKLGTGVTLTAARYMIFIDCPWTASMYNQACDRIFRIGTKRPVFIYNLICEGTIDETVDNIISKKKALANYIVDDKIENESALNTLQKYIEEI